MSGPNVESVVLPTITGLALIGVADPGQPNRERIVLRPLEYLNLGEYGLLLGLRAREDGSIVPLWDHFFWFGGVRVGPPSWVFVYTGAGEFSESKVVGTGEPVYAYHWGKIHTVFGGDPETTAIPMLVRLGGVAFGGIGQTHTPRTAEEINQAMKALSSLVGTPPPSGKPTLMTPFVLPPKPKVKP